MRRILAGLVLILMLTGGAAAGPFEDGVAAHERGDYATALRLWRPLAEQGTADAQYKLGVMYAKGRGFPQDYAEAAKWFRLAAEQGDADAQFDLGFMYERGEGVPQDYAEAVKWWRKAAELAIVATMLMCGTASARLVQYDCHYTKFHSPASNRIQDAKNLAIEFSVDTITNRAVSMGNKGLSDVTFITGTYGITFHEELTTGTVQTTTITKDGDSVHSRHSMISGDLVPSQYYGACVVVKINV
jgi:tetratricopeptide (TPR) repeat protein